MSSGTTSHCFGGLPFAATPRALCHKTSAKTLRARTLALLLGMIVDAAGAFADCAMVFADVVARHISPHGSWIGLAGSAVGQTENQWVPAISYLSHPLRDAHVLIEQLETDLRFAAKFLQPAICC
jgi:hypothetical protein